MKKLPTVTIAVSALNEQNNIKTFLSSVLKQKEEGFVIKEIWIFDDGSTDKTVEKVKEIKSSKIKIFSDKKRRGKSSRLNQIYSLLKTDYLFQSDADVILTHPYVIRDMILPLIKDKRIGMCGGNPTPAKGKTFIEKAINCTFEVYAPLRKTLRGGNNIFSVDGRILSYRKDFLKKIYVPVDTIANDAYTFFCCITKGYKYRYVPTGIVTFRSPKTLKDQIRQNTRFTAAPIRMSKLFSSEVVEREYFIPKHILFRNMAKQFAKHPIMCIYIYIVNWYCKLQAKRKESTLTAKWDMASSTKHFK